MSDLIAAIGIVLLLEGLLYAAFPDMMRRAAAEVSRVDPEVLRLVGLLAGISGLAVLWLVRG
jgi:hypothetical protein